MIFEVTTQVIPWSLANGRRLLDFYAHFWTFLSFGQVQKRTEEFLGDQNPSKSKMIFGLKMSVKSLHLYQTRIRNTASM